MSRDSIFLFLAVKHATMQLFPLLKVLFIIIWAYCLTRITCSFNSYSPCAFWDIGSHTVQMILNSVSVMNSKCFNADTLPLQVKGAADFLWSCPCYLCGPPTLLSCLNEISPPFSLLPPSPLLNVCAWCSICNLIRGKWIVGPPKFSFRLWHLKFNSVLLT